MSSSQRAYTRKWESAKKTKVFTWRVRLWDENSSHQKSQHRYDWSHWQFPISCPHIRRHRFTKTTLSILRFSCCWSCQYTASEVARNLRAVDWPEDRKLLTDAGGWHLSLKDVHNASAAWKKDHPNNKRQGNLSDWEEQRLETQEWLESEHWHVENIEVCYLR